MDVAAVKSLLLAAFPDAEVDARFEGSHCAVSVISETFSGMRPVARQQKVYAPLAGLIADGTIHAVNISARTPAEAER